MAKSEVSKPETLKPFAPNLDSYDFKRTPDAEGARHCHAAPEHKPEGIYVNDSETWVKLCLNPCSGPDRLYLDQAIQAKILSGLSSGPVVGSSRVAKRQPGHPHLNLVEVFVAQVLEGRQGQSTEVRGSC